MAKIGRNDPCPCGSGKKYKKCCLRKDEDKRLARLQSQQNVAVAELRAKREDDELFEEEIFRDRTAKEEDFENDEIDNDEYMVKGENLEVKPRKKIKDEVPEIGDRESTLVDAWWQRYKELDDPDEIREHLEGFFSQHPELVPNLELHHEVLFELGARYITEERHAEHIDLLVRIRDQFPGSYIKSFGFYDRDIISFKVIEGKKDEIPDYLGYFRQYPDHDPDNLFKTIDFLMVNNCQAIVAAFVRDIYHEVCTSPEIIGGDDILMPVIWSYFIPYLTTEFSENDIKDLSSQLKQITIPLRDDYYRADFLKKRFDSILGDYRKWSIDDCITNSDIYSRYDEITLNFAGFLAKEKNKDWMAAEFFRNMVYRYLVYVIPEGKRPKEAFVFTKRKIDETISKTCKDFISFDSTRTLGSLSALYYFAHYLESAESISKERKEEIQGWCSELFHQIFPHLKKQVFSAVAFERFPA